MAGLNVRVQPGARQNRLVGWMADGSLKVAVTAPPEAGRANEALMDLFARELGVRTSDVVVVRGWASRSKVIEVAGMETEELRRRVEAALAG